MNYANPEYSSLVIGALIVLPIFFIWGLHRRRALMERFVDRSLAANLAPSVSMGKKIVKIVVLVTAMALALYALMRPQWGFEWEEVKRTGLDIMIAIDVSKSMLAKDVKPNRLERSKFAVKDLIKKLNGDRIGLIAFAGTAFMQCPLTIDYNGFLLALDDISTSTIPRGGTSISASIREAMDAFKGQDKKFKILVIITDGEELEGDAMNAAAEAAKEGIKIYCVGVGTAEGELIPTVSERGERGYVSNRDGTVVKTRLNEDLLKRIAISTGGSYVRATQAEFGLSLLYDKSIARLERRDIETKMKKRFHEHFQVFLACAVILLCMEALISEKKGLVL